MRAVLLVLGGMMLVVSVWTLIGCLIPPTPTIPSSPASFIARLVPDERTLINLTDFEFYTKVSCNSSSSSFVVIVHSATMNTMNRRIIRSTWGKGLPLFFMVGQANSTEIQNEIDWEIQVHGDIVQGSFMDSYRNLTYKHVMSLKWVSYFCPSARYILKIDDDVFVNTPRFLEYIQDNVDKRVERLIQCSIREEDFVVRTYRSKWRVSPREYPRRFYPTYCRGWVIIYSFDALLKLYNEAQTTPYFWIDDVHITGTVREKTDLSLSSLQGLELSDFGGDLIILNKMKGNFVFAPCPPERLEELWEVVTE